MPAHLWERAWMRRVTRQQEPKSQALRAQAEGSQRRHLWTGSQPQQAMAPRSGGMELQEAWFRASEPRLRPATCAHILALRVHAVWLWEGHLASLCFPSFCVHRSVHPACLVGLL